MGSFADDLVARFGIAPPPMCGAADLIEFAFDNLRAQWGRKGWSPQEFATELFDAFSEEGLFSTSVSAVEFTSAVQAEANKIGLTSN